MPERDPRLHPFESRWFTHDDGLRQHYLDEGPQDAPILLMVHGNPTWSYYWRALVSRYRRQFRCIVPDHMGCGLSDRPDDNRYPYTLARRIADLEALMQAVSGTQPVTLLLHDWGGAIGMGWAVAHPERIQRIVLFNTAAFNLPQNKRLPLVLKLVRNTRAGAWLVERFNAFALGAAWIGFHQPVATGVRQALVSPYAHRQDRLATLRFVQDIPLAPDDPAWPVLEQIEQGLERFRQTPVQIFWGLKDFVFDRIILDHWRTLWPQADIHAWNDCGHYVVEDARARIPGLLDGFLARPPEQPQQNIARHLPRHTQQYPWQMAVACPVKRDRQGRYTYRHYSYRQLERESARLAAGLRAVGIQPGTRVALMVSPGLDFFALTFALFRMKAVPVLIDPGIGLRNLKNCLAEAEPEAFIGIPKAHLARRLLNWAPRSVRTTVITGRSRLGLAGWSLEQIRRLGRPEGWRDPATDEDETAAILFTSGSTGIPKGVIYQHRQFNAQVELLRQTYHIENGEWDMPTFPLFALFAPALGMSCVIPDMNPTRPARAEPQRLLQAVEDFGVNSLFGSPALLRRLAEHHPKTVLQPVKRIISAGATVPPDVLAAMQALLLPPAQVHTPYGATECLPVSTISAEELQETRQATEQGAGICVGQPLPANRVRIIAIDDRPIGHWHEAQELPTAQVGEITVCGPSVTESYYNRPQATAMAKIRDGDRIVHRMGDVGYLDEQGRLWFCGRMSQRVETEQGRLFTDQCEAVFNAIEGLQRTALVGVGPPGRQRPVLVVETATATLPRAQLLQRLRERARQIPRVSAIQTFLFYPRFPVDIRHNAKIRREQLARWAAKKR